MRQQCAVTAGLIMTLIFSVAAVLADEEAAVAALKKFNANIGRDKKKPDNPVFLVEINGSVSAVKPKDSDLAVLKEFKSLRWLSLGGSTTLTDAVMKEVKEIKTLQRLILNYVPITDYGLYEIQDLTALRALSLSDTKVTDEGMKYFRKMKELRDLFLERTRISDAGLAELKNLPNLTGILLDGTLVTDAGLKELKDLPKLESVLLNKTRITDAGLRELKKYKNLQQIQVRETRVTLEGLKDFKAAFPQCSIGCDDAFLAKLNKN
jgi:hypothetical protein